MTFITIYFVIESSSMNIISKVLIDFICGFLKNGSICAYNRNLVQVISRTDNVSGNTAVVHKFDKKVCSVFFYFVHINLLPPRFCT